MNTSTWYVDIRTIANTEQISLDLARHLPRRLAVGPALIIADRPKTLLPVLRKRWVRITREVERQCSSTLQPEKRFALRQELERMRTLRFKTPTSPKAELANVLLISPGDVPVTSFSCRTIYIACALSDEDFCMAMANLSVAGVVVTYNEPNQQWQEILRNMLRNSEG